LERVPATLAIGLNSQTPSSDRIPLPEGSEQAGPPAPLNIPDHQLLNRIGRGSYGEVWLGRNKLGTLRAIKIVHRAAFDDARPFEREFKGIQKFEPISRSHDGLVDILQVGGTEEYFYYVMELADDANDECRMPNDKLPARPASENPSSSFVIRHSSLYSPRTLRSDLKRLGRLPIAECLRIGLSLADALAHLHRQRLVHRDIKPSNIIFVGGAPKLADIGLVADLGEARSFVGTQGFIPPEGPGTPQADLYSLGKVLYELSTGKDRLEFPELPEDLLVAASRESATISFSSERGNRGNSAALSRDAATKGDLIELNAVLVKACATDPRQRYQSAEELHADLALLECGESVKHERTIQRRWAAITKISLVAGLIALMPIGGSDLRQAVNGNEVGGAGGRIQPEMKGTKNREAWNAYLNGLHYYKRDTPDGSKRAIEYLKEAIRLDAKFAQPHATLAEIYRWSDYLFPSGQEAMGKGKEEALQALALDDSLARAHKELAYVAAHLDRDFAKAEKEVKRAIELSPDYAGGHGQYAWLSLERRRFEEAKKEMKQCLSLDPVYPRSYCTASIIFRAAGEPDEGLRQLRKALDLDPNYWWAFEQLGEIHEEKGEFPEAIEMFRKAAIAHEVEPEKVAQRSVELRRALSTGGAKEYWRKKLELADVRSNFGGDLYDIAVIYLKLDETDSMFEFLERVEAEKWDHAFRVNFDRRFDGVRSHPRFQALLRKLGLDKYSETFQGDAYERPQPKKMGLEK